jgi:hypothetical protein
VYDSTWKHEEGALFSILHTVHLPQCLINLMRRFPCFPVKHLFTDPDTQLITEGDLERNTSPTTRKACAAIALVIVE